MKHQNIGQFIVIALILVSMLVLNIADINKIIFKDIVPLEIPEDYFEINDWLKNNIGDYKVAWLPPQYDARFLAWNKNNRINDFVSGSSGKPTIAPHEPYSRLYFKFIESRLKDKIMLSKYFTPLNTKYLIFRSDLPEGYSDTLRHSLKTDKGLTQVMGRQYLDLFENKSYSKEVWFPEEAILVVGGLEALEALYSVPEFNPLKTAIIFVNQQFGLSGVIENHDWDEIFFSNSTIEDLAFSLVPEKYILAPANTTYGKQGAWRKASTQEPLHGEWHRNIDQMALDNWDFDFGKNLIFSENNGDVYEGNLNLDQANKKDYMLIVRYFQNMRGGSIEIKIDGTYRQVINTISETNKFNLAKFKIKPSSEDQVRLEMKNLGGFNALNVLAFIPIDVFQEKMNVARNLVDDHKVSYFQKVSPEMIINQTNIEPLLPENRVVNILLKNEYTALNESAVRPDNFSKNKTSLFFNNKEYLPEDQIAGEVWTDVDKVTSSKNQQVYFKGGTTSQGIIGPEHFIALDKDFVDIAYYQKSVQVKINSLYPEGMRKGRIISNAVPVQGDQWLYLDYLFSSKDIDDTSARVLFLGEDYDPETNRTAFEVEYFMENKFGNIEKEKIFKFIRIPREASFIQIEFKSLPNTNVKSSEYTLSDIKVLYKDTLSPISAIMFKEVQLVKENSAQSPDYAINIQNPARISLTAKNDIDGNRFVMLSEGYNSDWFAKSSQKDLVYQSFPGYGPINAFYLDEDLKSGDQISFEFEPQNDFALGLRITKFFLTFLVIFSSYLIIRKRRKNLAG